MTDPRAALSPNARRWLDACLPVEAPTPERILNTQEGQIDVRGKWLQFAAETRYDLRSFGYGWRARIAVMPGVWVVAKDGHDGATGWGGAKLWGILPAGGLTGPEVFKMQLMRHFAELPWMPEQALALPGVVWTDRDDGGFELKAEVGGASASVRFDLSSDGDIARASGLRAYDVPDGFVEAPWRCDYSEHTEFSGVRVPARAVSTYEKADGEWTYWRARLTSR